MCTSITLGTARDFMAFCMADGRWESVNMIEGDGKHLENSVETNMNLMKLIVIACSFIYYSQFDKSLKFYINIPLITTIAFSNTAHNIKHRRKFQHFVLNNRFTANVVMAPTFAKIFYIKRK